jgi:hypothetical protein
LATFSKLSTNRAYADLAFSPMRSSEPFTNSLDFDNNQKTYTKDMPTLLQGKEDLMPLSIPAVY